VVVAGQKVYKKLLKENVFFQNSAKFIVADVHYSQLNNQHF